MHIYIYMYNIHIWDIVQCVADSHDDPPSYARSSSNIGASSFPGFQKMEAFHPIVLGRYLDIFARNIFPKLPIIQVVGGGQEKISPIFHCCSHFRRHQKGPNWSCCDMV